MKIPIIKSAEGVILHETAHVKFESDALNDISKYCLPSLNSFLTDLFNGSSTSIDIPLGKIILYVIFSLGSAVKLKIFAGMSRLGGIIEKSKEIGYEQ